MAGETIRAKAVCLAVRPWSRTSHIVAWLTPAGRVTTVVKGAVRPKSAFLGQYDLNYTCEILYYARAKGDLHALRECTPLVRRDALRGDYRALMLADYFRRLTGELAPAGPDGAEWAALLTRALDALDADAAGKTAAALPARTIAALQRLLAYEMDVLALAGLTPELGDGGEDGCFQLRGERRIPVSREVFSCLKRPSGEKNIKILLDAARVIGVFYAFHVDCAGDVRRTVLRMISTNE
jgi:recombinational DNA repair protein (RecF pathway)